jgi:nuclear-control-of-ATPase protein 2
MVRILRYAEYKPRGPETAINVVLRNIDRILTASTPSNNGMLSYKDHGLLLYEVHTLRQNGQQVLPEEINREFLEEINDLVDIRTGVDRQLKVVERIRWAYSRWLR